MSQTFYKKGFLALAVAAALGVSTFVQADVKIGVAGPMTGANAAFGEQYMKGAQAAFIYCSPNDALAPVIGPATPIFTSA